MVHIYINTALDMLKKMMLDPTAFRKGTYILGVRYPYTLKFVSITPVLFGARVKG